MQVLLKAWCLMGTRCLDILSQCSVKLGVLYNPACRGSKEPILQSHPESFCFAFLLNLWPAVYSPSVKFIFPEIKRKMIQMHWMLECIFSCWCWVCVRTRVCVCVFTDSLDGVHVSAPAGRWLCSCSYKPPAPVCWVCHKIKMSLKESFFFP